jgi:hypothetical protein
MQTITLSWLPFNVNLSLVQTYATSIDSNCCGLSANPNGLKIHFTDTISNEKIQQLKNYWSNLTNTSNEALEYKTQEQLKIEENTKKETLKASSIAKLKALGLSDEECSILIK